MRLDLVSDVGAPAAVTVANIMARASTKNIGPWPAADAVTYAMAIGGYAAAYMGWGPPNMQPFVKNVAIAAAPLAFEKIYNQLRGGMTSRVSGARMRVSRYPGPANEGPFQGVRLV